MTYSELKTKFTELFSRSGRASIKAKDMLSLIIELIDKILGIDVTATATIRKSYNTLALANADLNPIDPETNKPIKIGQLISVVADTTLDNNAVYRLSAIAVDGTPTWERQAALGDMSIYQKASDATLTTTDKTISGGIKELKLETDRLDDEIVQLAGKTLQNAGSIIAGSTGTDVNDKLNKIFIDIIIYKKLEENQFLGIDATENGFKYLTGEAGEYKRYGFAIGLYTWGVNGSITRTQANWDLYWIERPVGSTDYDTWYKTGVERITTRDGNHVVFDWDAYNTVQPPNQNTRGGTTALNIKYAKINPSKYSLSRQLSDTRLISESNAIFNSQLGIDSKDKYNSVGVASGAIKVDANTIRIPVGSSGNGSNMGIYFEWNKAVDNTTNLFPKDLYFSVTYKVLKGSKTYIPLNLFNYTGGYFSKASNFSKNIDGVNGLVTISGVFNDLKSTYLASGNGSAATVIFIGINFTGSTPLTSEFEMQIVNSQIYYTTYPEYTSDSGSRIEISKAFSKALSDNSVNVYQKNYYNTQVFDDAVKLSSNDGFYVPANGLSQWSLIRSRLSDFSVEKEVTINIYYFKDNPNYIVINRVHITDKNGANEKAITVPSIKITDNIYKISYTYTPSATNLTDNNRIDISIQSNQVGALVSPTTIKWISASYNQSYTSDENSGEMGFTDKSIKKIAEESALNLLHQNTTEIVVTADENATGYQFKGKNAVQEAIDSIADASETNRYSIYVMPGLYKITNSSEFIGSPGYPAMICMKDYVDVVGHSKEGVIFWAELPYDDATIDTEIERIKHQTVWNWAKESTMKNCTLVAKNLRYVVHQDSSLAAMKSRYYENVDLIFLGDKGSLNCWGLGSFNGEKNYLKGGKAITTNGNAWSCHNNRDFKYPSLWDIENYTFMSIEGTIAINLQNSGSLLNDEFKIVGCGFDGKSNVIHYRSNWLYGGQYSSFNHAEWRVRGHRNQPFLFNNVVGGQSLRIVSKSIGLNSKVRFDKSSTAFNDLIRNPKGTDNASIAIPEFEIIDRYLIKDGSTGLSGWANGCRDLSGVKYAYDAGVLDSLGVNLGDCSVTNKTLIINIDGINYTVTFNKNYTAMTNTAILAEINAVIGTVATASLYYIGRDYYPELTDVTELVLNESATVPILKGTVLSKSTNGRVKPCADGEKIFGVALDDIPVFSNIQGVVKGYSRALKRGYIETLNTAAFFVNALTNPIAGTRMKSVDGQLVTAVDGECVGIADNVVSINC